jgi:hypothetical protein
MESDRRGFIQKAGLSLAAAGGLAATGANGSSDAAVRWAEPAASDAVAVIPPSC